MHRHWRWAVTLLGALVVTGGLTAAGQRPAPQDPEASILFTTPPSPKEEEEAEEKKEEKEKPFEEVVEDLERIEGLFTFYRDPEKNKVLLEILPEQFDQDYLASVTLEQGVGERGLYGTGMFDESIFQWHRMGARVQLVEKNIRFRARAGSPAQRALESSFSDSVFSSAKILSKPHPERNSVLVDLGEILLGSDLQGAAQFLRVIYGTGYKYIKADSGFLMVKSFPLNSEIEVVMNFRASEVKRGSVTLPDPRSLNLRFRYSLVQLPENDYRPRLADDRVGYFMDQFMDFTSDKPDTPYVRYAARWHLQKKDPNARLSDPVQPIVFWLENTIPEEYRPFFREGVLLWNPAFERIGFRNALVVKQQPDDADWDPADIRYNTIRWFLAYDAAFAQGPSHTNPYTGQILDADIRFSEGIVRLGARRRFQLYVDPVQRLQRLQAEPLATPGLFGRRFNPRYLCTYAEELVEQASLAYDILSARPGWSSEKEREFIRQYIVEVTAHEVGHTLGLRHNFRASTINRLDQLADQQRSRTVGLAASVMDYNPAIIALEGEEQGDYLPQVVGSYDQWAIEYGYKPIPGAQTPEEELPELQRIASQGADPLHPYATDEDAGISPRALDPRNTRFDFTDDPLEWFSHEIRLIHELWANMESTLLEPGDSYEILRRSFNYSWTPYFRGAHVAMKHIGGIYHDRDHLGDPNGSLPFVPVPAAKQREALQWLAREIWAPDAFQFPAELLQRLQFPRFWDFEFSAFTAPRLDYPLHDTVLFVQSEIFYDLYHPIKLQRLQDLELYFPDPNLRFTLANLFVGIREAIWSELESGQPINSFRRNLQRAHLGHLIRILLHPTPGTPEDALTLARADLVQLEKQIDQVLRTAQLDYTNRAHLEETGARIHQALEAQLQRSQP